MNAADTIVAPSTAAGIASRAVVRMSGPDAFTILRALTNVELWERPTVRAVRIDLGAGLALGCALYTFPAPRSSTGEDVAELHVVGSPLLVRRSLDCLLAAGARLAEPGEFTARAFFNGKLDLSSAEGVAATIGASNRAELDAARSLLAGELARRLTPALETLVGLLALVEADVDFAADEDIDALNHSEIVQRIDAMIAGLGRLLRDSTRLERLAHEPRIVLVGRPNAGKSTLLNRLAGHARAVVSATAGTTRDALSARVSLPGGTVTLIDVAGLDDRAAHDAIERQMSEQAHRAVAQADRIVYVRDVADARPSVDVGRPPDLIVWTKVDLSPASGPHLCVSATTGQGMDDLAAALDRLAFHGGTRDAVGALALNARHVREIEHAVHALREAREAVGHGVELVASSLRQAVGALGKVLGRVSPDDVLGRIFSSFCIGK